MTEIEIVKQIAENGCLCIKCDECIIGNMCSIDQVSRSLAKLWLAEHDKPKPPLLTFENVSSQILGSMQLLDLTLPISKQNKQQCLEAYAKSGQLKVTIEIEEPREVG